MQYVPNYLKPEEMREEEEKILPTPKSPITIGSQIKNLSPNFNELFQYIRENKSIPTDKLIEKLIYIGQKPEGSETILYLKKFFDELQKNPNGPSTITETTEKIREVEENLAYEKSLPHYPDDEEPSTTLPYSSVVTPDLDQIAKWFHQSFYGEVNLNSSDEIISNINESKILTDMNKRHLMRWLYKILKNGGGDMNDMDCFNWDISTEIFKKNKKYCKKFINFCKLNDRCNASKYYKKCFFVFSFFLLNNYYLVSYSPLSGKIEGIILKYYGYVSSFCDTLLANCKKINDIANLLENFPILEAVHTVGCSKLDDIVWKCPECVVCITCTGKPDCFCWECCSCAPYRRALKFQPFQYYIEEKKMTIEYFLAKLGPQSHTVATGIPISKYDKLVKLYAEKIKSFFRWNRICRKNKYTPPENLVALLEEYFIDCYNKDFNSAYQILVQIYPDKFIENTTNNSNNNNN